MKVLLLGSNGQLGSKLKGTVPGSITLIPCSHGDLDITSRDAVSRHLDQIKPDWVINAAAYTKVDLAETEKESAYKVNAEAVGYLAESVSPPARILHISTDYVFDGRAHTPYGVNAKTNPLNAYGKSKLAGEKRLQDHANCIIIRASWLYAARGSNFLLTMLRLMRERESLDVVSDETGSPTAVNSLADVIWRSVTGNLAGGVYHWTDGGAISWYDFALAIQEDALALGLLDKKIPVMPISSKEYATAASRPQYSVLDRSKLMQALGLSPTPWREQLKEVLLEIKNSRSNKPP